MEFSLLWGPPHHETRARAGVLKQFTDMTRRKAEISETKITFVRVIFIAATLSLSLAP